MTSFRQCRKLLLFTSFRSSSEVSQPTTLGAKLAHAKRLIPPAARRILRGCARQLEYVFLRVVGRILYPMLGATVPLRGYETATKDYVARSGDRYLSVEPAQVITYSKRPQDRFVSPETYVAIIANGRVAFDYGVTITRQHTLLADAASQFGSLPRSHAALFAKRFPPVRNIRGTVAVLSSSAHQRYFHWMFDVLPRLELLHMAKIKVDKYVVNKERRFQRETLETLRIDPAIIISPSSETHIKADELIVPSLPGTSGLVTPKSCQFLRANFLRDVPCRNPNRLLYVTRKDALTRRVVNEAEIIACLQKCDFEVIELEHQTVAEQVELFASARIIVGPHGAGFTNLVFSQVGTALIEFMPETYFNPCFEILAGLMSLKYYRLPSRSLSLEVHDQYVDKKDVERVVGLLLS